MTRIQTKSGFVCNVDENRARDWRFAKNLAKLDDTSTILQGMAFVVPFLLGEDGEKALMKHVQDKKGIYPTDKILAEFREIMDLLGAETKKSGSSPE